MHSVRSQYSDFTKRGSHVDKCDIVVLLEVVVRSDFIIHPELLLIKY